MSDPVIVPEPITVTIDNPGRGNPFSRDDFSFVAGPLCIHLSAAEPKDEVHFQLSGSWKGGSEIPENKLRFGSPGHEAKKGEDPDDVNGIMWYPVNAEQEGNEWMNDGQVQAVNTWIDANQPTPDPSDGGARTYLATIDRADVQRMTPGSNVIHLYYRIYILARKHHEDDWYGAIEDPEVDLELDD